MRGWGQPNMNDSAGRAANTRIAQARQSEIAALPEYGHIAAKQRSCPAGRRREARPTAMQQHCGVCRFTISELLVSQQCSVYVLQSSSSGCLATDAGQCVRHAEQEGQRAGGVAARRFRGFHCGAVRAHVRPTACAARVRLRAVAAAATAEGSSALVAVGQAGRLRGARRWRHA
jgi:hypothetical protein